MRASRPGLTAVFHTFPNWPLISSIYLLGSTSTSRPVPTLPASQALAAPLPTLIVLEPKTNLEEDDKGEDLEEEPIEVEGDHIDSDDKLDDAKAQPFDDAKMDLQ